MRTFYLIFVFFTLLFGVVSCNNDSDDDFMVSEKTIIIDYKTQMIFDPVHNKERPYLRIKFTEDASEWTTIYGISGFNYEEGYIYILKVKEKVIRRPLEDQPQTNYEFLSLISKTKSTETRVKLFHSSFFIHFSFCLFNNEIEKYF